MNQDLLNPSKPSLSEVLRTTPKWLVALVVVGYIAFFWLLVSFSRYSAAHAERLYGGEKISPAYTAKKAKH